MKPRPMEDVPTRRKTRMFNVQQDSRRCRHSLRAPETRTEPSSQVSQREPAAAQYKDPSTRSEVCPFQRTAHDIIGDQKKWKTSRNDASIRLGPRHDQCFPLTHTHSKLYFSSANRESRRCQNQLSDAMRRTTCATSHV